MSICTRNQKTGRVRYRVLTWQTSSLFAPRNRQSRHQQQRSATRDTSKGAAETIKSPPVGRSHGTAPHKIYMGVEEQTLLLMPCVSGF
ncbi:hypothetical protein CEXT_243471 [Caerostris extrusa]|uniref:Uncharacterized protein n=1 Tax=Caerostris extrusa TaxID=172846 RepID=A0AAV4U198_CAEEX|nr:hypothetical protein CEXT_243471 [Caerostris extrusa]